MLALHFAASRLPHGVKLGYGFHAFGHNIQAEAMAYFEGRQHDGVVARIGRQVGEKVSINVWFGERKLADVREPGLAGAVIAKRNANADVLQRTQRLHRCVDFIERARLVISKHSREASTALPVSFSATKRGNCRPANRVLRCSPRSAV